MPKIRKKTSKRISLREKYSCLKKVANHHRKLKKSARKLKKQGFEVPFKGSNKKSLIPNSFPDKENYVNFMEKLRLQQIEEKKKLKEKKLDVNLDLDGKQVYDFQIGDTGKTGDAIIKQEEKYQSGLTQQEMAQAEELIDPEGVQTQKLNTVSKKGNWREVKKAIEASDVVVQVLDARDPEGTRCQQIEELIAQEGKKLIFVINKVDMVPEENLKAWKKYYKQLKLLTVGFKSNEIVQKSNDDDDDEEMKEEKPQSLQEKSKEQLMNYLFKYARAFAEKKQQDQITVAIVGYANVGKSSLINVLKNRFTVQTSSNAFLTRANKVVKLSGQVNLIDTPGILLQGLQTDQSKAGSAQLANYNMRLLRSSLQVDDLSNPEQVIPSVLERVQKFELLRHYRIADFNDDINKLLELVAIKKNIMKDAEPANVPMAKSASEQEKKGKKKKKQQQEMAEQQAKLEQVPDPDQAARRILRDFLNNRLSFHSQVPEE